MQSRQGGRQLLKIVMSPITCAKQSPPFTSLGWAPNKTCNLNIINQQYVYFFLWLITGQVQVSIRERENEEILKIRTFLVVQTLQIHRREWTVNLLTNITHTWVLSQLCVTFLNAFKNVENLKVMSAVFYITYNQNVSSHPETLQSAYGRQGDWGMKTNPFGCFSHVGALPQQSFALATKLQLHLKIHLLYAATGSLSILLDMP